MYIIDRNQAERAEHSKFDEAVLSPSSAERALLWLLPIAAASLLLLLWAMFLGASPMALVVALIFFLAALSGRSQK